MRIIKESNISRLLRHGKAHDCGSISAYTSHGKERKDFATGARGDNEFNAFKKQKNRENINNSRQLAQDLRDLGYSVTKIKGHYGYMDDVAQDEMSWFVSDTADTGNLEKDLIKLGTKYDQESILFQSAGEKPYLVYTRNDGKVQIGARTPAAVSTEYGATFDKNDSWTEIKGRPIKHNFTSFDYKMNEQTSKKYKHDFKTVYESYYSRYTAALFTKGDVIEFDKAILNDEAFKAMPEEMRLRVTDMVEAQQAGDAIIAIANVGLNPFVADQYEPSSLTLAYSQGGGMYYGQTTVSGSLGKYMKIINGVESILPKNAIKRDNISSRRAVDMETLKQAFRSGYSPDIRKTSKK